MPLHGYNQKVYIGYNLAVVGGTLDPAFPTHKLVVAGASTIFIYIYISSSWLSLVSIYHSVMTNISWCKFNVEWRWSLTIPHPVPVRLSIYVIAITRVRCGGILTLVSCNIFRGLEVAVDEVYNIDQTQPTPSLWLRMGFCVVVRYVHA